MRARSLLATAATLALVTSVGAISPAQAYDRDAYAYAAGHMIQRSDIPKSLGKFKPGMIFNAGPNGGSLYVCYVPTSDPNSAGKQVKVAGTSASYEANYDGRGDNAPFISVSVNQYPSVMKAIKAFDSLKAKIKQCAGTGSDTWTDDDGNTTTYSTEVTNGVVPSVSTAGVESLFVSNNNLSETVPSGAASVTDNYTVFSLFDDTIIQTSYSLGDANGTKNLTTAQRKAVNQVAFNAETRWLD